MALKDYESVKHLNPGNMIASEGLSRLHKIINKDDDLKRSLEKSRNQDASRNKQKEIEKTESKAATESSKQDDIEADLKRYEEEKVQGNNYFKDSNFYHFIVKNYYREIPRSKRCFLCSTRKDQRAFKART